MNIESKRLRREPDPKSRCATVHEPRIYELD